MLPVLLSFQATPTAASATILALHNYFFYVFHIFMLGKGFHLAGCQDRKYKELGNLSFHFSFSWDTAHHAVDVTNMYKISFSRLGT